MSPDSSQQIGHQNTLPMPLAPSPTNCSQGPLMEKWGRTVSAHVDVTSRATTEGSRPHLAPGCFCKHTPFSICPEIKYSEYKVIQCAKIKSFLCSRSQQPSSYSAGNLPFHPLGTHGSHSTVELPTLHPFSSTDNRAKGKVVHSTGRVWRGQRLTGTWRQGTSSRSLCSYADNA